MVTSIVAMLRGGNGGGGGADLTPLINALNIDFSNLNNDKLTTLINVLNNSAQMHTDLQDIVTALGGSSNVLVYQWANGFDPTAGAGVAVPVGKAAFGWDAETSPGAGDGELFIYTGPTPKKWVALPGLFNLAQAWSTIYNIVFAWNNAGGMPPIQYLNPAINPDSNAFDIIINNQGNTSFKTHILAVAGGTGYAPPPVAEGVMLGIRVNGLLLPTNGTLPGVLTYSDRGRAGSALENNPPLIDMNDDPPANIYDHTRPGDIFDITLESLWPYSFNLIRMLRIKSMHYSPSRADRCAIQEGFVPITTAEIASVGLELVIQGTPAPVFDHVLTFAAKIENGY